MMHKLKILFAVLLCPVLLQAQKLGPKFKNDTAYSIGGYPIYKGQVLHFAKGSGKNGNFKFINVKNGILETVLMNNSVVVNDLNNFGKNEEDDGFIDVTGSVIFKDSTKGNVQFKLFFDKAIENNNGMPGEMIVPATYINNAKIILYKELKRLLNAYVGGTINRETYEAQKKKLLEAQ